jgi:hypothetical protein
MDIKFSKKALHYGVGYISISSALFRALLLPWFNVNVFPAT